MSCYVSNSFFLFLFTWIDGRQVNLFVDHSQVLDLECIRGRNFGKNHKSVLDSSFFLCWNMVYYMCDICNVNAYETCICCYACCVCRVWYRTYLSLKMIFFFLNKSVEIMSFKKRYIVFFNILKFYISNLKRTQDIWRSNVIWFVLNTYPFWSFIRYFHFCHKFSILLYISFFLIIISRKFFVGPISWA